MMWLSSLELDYQPKDLERFMDALNSGIRIFRTERGYWVYVMTPFACQDVASLKLLRPSSLVIGSALF